MIHNDGYTMVDVYWLVVALPQSEKIGSSTNHVVILGQKKRLKPPTSSEWLTVYGLWLMDVHGYSFQLMVNLLYLRIDHW